METIDTNENGDSTTSSWVMALVMLFILFGLYAAGAFVMLAAIKTF